MKSETLVKIKENRIKYFLEIKNQKTEEKTGLKFKNIDLPANVDGEEKSVLPKIAFTFSQRQFLEKIKANKILKDFKRTVQQFINRITLLNNSISNSILKSTEKMRNRVFSFLMVLFDA